MARMEEILGAQKFFTSQSDQPGAADLIVWPWLERLEPMRTFNSSKIINENN